MRSQRVIIVGVALVFAAIASLVVSRAMCSKAGPDGGRGSVPSAKAVPQVDPPPIQVLVTRLTPVPGGVMYRYTVVNGSAFPITALLVGFDEYYGVPKLASEPVGWDGDSLPPTSYQAPPGWTCTVEPTEDDSLTDVKWEISGQTGAIMGGESVGGFAVILAQADPTYDNGSLWTAYVRGDSPLWGSLQPSGVTSVPASSIFAQSDLKVSPNPTGGTAVIQFAMPVTGKVTVDIFDVQGRRVRRILDERRTAGNSSASWDGKDDSGKEAGSGVYFVRVKTPTTQRFGRLIRMRGDKER
jgi:hypothetical protein